MFHNTEKGDLEVYDKETFERYTVDAYCQDVETMGLNEVLLSQNVPLQTVSK